MPTTIEVFISYSHDSPEHESRVLKLADRLRADGIDAIIDQYQTVPPEGWQLWMEKQIRDAKFVLLVCTETFLRRVMKEEMLGKGLGVMWESTIIYSYIYDSGVINEKFIPVFFVHSDMQFIPRPLQPTTYYNVSGENGYDLLYRRLTGQPTTPAGPLGLRRTLPPLARLSTASHNTIRTRVPNLVHPYPLQANFTGRDRERRELTEWLNDERHPIFEIVAIGGMGKSALTWYWITHDVLSGIDVKLDGVMWWSFYEGESSFARFIDDALKYVSGRPIDTDEMRTMYDRAQELRKQLQSKRVLFVLDGFERQLRDYGSLDDAYKPEVTGVRPQDARACVDPTAARLLRDFAAGATRAKVLLTTRLPVSDLEDRVGALLAGVGERELHQLQPYDSVVFMRAQCVAKGTYTEIANACGAYGHHPLSLRLLSGLIARDLKMPGDISAAPQHDVHDDLVQRQHHVLENAYNALPKRERALVSRIAAFRSAITYEALAIFNTLGSEKRFDEAIGDLCERGLLQRDFQNNRFDLHPIVRHYCYERLIDKSGAHTRLRDYFSQIPIPDEQHVQRVEDLTPVIELYHHTICSGLHDEALLIFRDQLTEPLYYRFGAFNTCIELLRCLLSDEDSQPQRLQDLEQRGWVLNTLAAAYTSSGQPLNAMQAYLQGNRIAGDLGQKSNSARALTNMGITQVMLGKLEAAWMNFRRSLEVTSELHDNLWGAVTHSNIGQLFTYRGEFDKAEAEFQIAQDVFDRYGPFVSSFQALTRTQRARLELTTGKAMAALDSARQARSLVDEVRKTHYPIERDYIETEWLFGAAQVMEGSDLGNASKHLTDALTRCRRINLVEIEPNILLTLAHWHQAQGNVLEAQMHADEALEIADRCEFRLAQAEIHNFLAHLAFDAGDRQAAVEHAEIAKERAWCDGPPYCYKPALDEAIAVLEAI